MTIKFKANNIYITVINNFQPENNLQNIPDRKIDEQDDQPMGPRQIDQDEPIRKRGEPWQEKKARSSQLVRFFHEIGLNKKGNRVHWCGTELGFDEAGKLVMANFCRERLCIMCSWRKSVKTYWELSNVLDAVQDSEPNLDTIFLTLTVRNCPGEELREILGQMFKGWAKLTEHRRFKDNIKGWFRALEVTYNKDEDTYHPHFHALLMVDKSYFKQENKNYLHTVDWVHIWRVSCGLDYDPVCYVRGVKTTKGRGRKHVAELAKYTVKDTDILQKVDAQTVKILTVLTWSLKGRQLFAYGGNLRKTKKLLGKIKDPDQKSTIREDIADAMTIYKWDFGLQDYFRRDR